VRIPKIRRRWFIVGIVVIVALVAIRLLDQPLRLESYRTLDEQTIAVVGYGAPYSWARVTAVKETGSAVTVSVNAITIQLGAGSEAATRIYIPIYLSEPLGDRAVIDKSSGQEVPRAP
jgi:hypothetical protein